MGGVLGAIVVAMHNFQPLLTRIMKRQPSHELLDSDAGSPREIAASLTDLRMFNRWFGGLTCTTSLVERVARDTGANSLSWLDVAAGAGYVARTVSENLSHRNLHLNVTLLDRSASHVGNGGHSVVGDALALPFREGSFDLVSSELFVHHLSPDQVIQFVREGLRVCRRAFLINDLIRDPLHLPLPTPGSRYTAAASLATTRLPRCVRLTRSKRCAA